MAKVELRCITIAATACQNIISGEPTTWDDPTAGFASFGLLYSPSKTVVRKVSGGLDPECEEVGEQLFAFLISLLHR